MGIDSWDSRDLILGQMLGLDMVARGRIGADVVSG